MARNVNVSKQTVDELWAFSSFGPDELNQYDITRGRREFNYEKPRAVFSLGWIRRQHFVV